MQVLSKFDFYRVFQLRIGKSVHKSVTYSMNNIYVVICQGITPSHTNNAREAREHYIISMYFNIYVIYLLFYIPILYFLHASHAH